MSTRHDLAFWRGLTCGLALGLLATLLLYWTPAGTKRPSDEARAFQAIGELLQDGRHEDLVAVMQHFGEAEDQPSAPRTERAHDLVVLLEDLEPGQRRAFLSWLRSMPWETGNDP